MADQNKKKYIKYEDTTYILEDSRIPDPAGFNNKVLGVVNGAYALKDEEGGGGSGGTGLSDDAKAALLACFRNVAWIGSDGQDYYDDLYDALYPPAHPAVLLSISATFNQGSHTVYDTDSLDTLKQYLTVTAHYDDSSTSVVNNYTLVGTLTESTSTITVVYNNKTTTFNVTVSAYWDYQWDYTMGKLEEQAGWTLDKGGGGSSVLTDLGEEITTPTGYYQPYIARDGELANLRNFQDGIGVIETTFVGHYSTTEDNPNFEIRAIVSTDSPTRRAIICINKNSKFVLRGSPGSPASAMVLADFLPDTECTVKVVCKGETADFYVNGELKYADFSMGVSEFGSSTCVMCQGQGEGFYTYLKAVKIKSGAY